MSNRGTHTKKWRIAKIYQRVLETTFLKICLLTKNKEWRNSRAHRNNWSPYGAEGDRWSKRWIESIPMDKITWPARKWRDELQAFEKHWTRLTGIKMNGKWREKSFPNKRFTDYYYYYWLSRTLSKYWLIMIRYCDGFERRHEHYSNNVNNHFQRLSRPLAMGL